MVAQSSSLNVVGVSPLHGLIGVGGVEVRPKQQRDHANVEPFFIDVVTWRRSRAWWSFSIRDRSRPPGR
jgi:hypothetical protein